MFATIYLPNFYLQAAIRHHPKLRAQPVALIDASKSKVSIIQLNELAEKAGVAKGMRQLVLTFLNLFASVAAGSTSTGMAFGI